MGYWENRLGEQLIALADKSIFDTCDEIARYYKTASRRLVKDYVGLFKQIVDEVGQDNLRPNHIYQFDKYYQLMEQSKQILQELGNKEILLMNEKYKEMYQIIYEKMDLPYKTINTFTISNSAKAEQVVNSIWCADGKHWSQRVWDNTRHLQQSLEDGLAQAIINGIKGDELKANLMQDFGVSYSAANRLVRTEMAHIETVAAKERYKDSGVKKVKVLIELDACDDCEKMRDQEFDIDDAGSLVPLHPNCRCCIIPVI